MTEEHCYCPMTRVLCCVQVEAFSQRLGELAAFDVQNPSGRFMLNLSRAIDRLVALRLQVRVSHLVLPQNPCP